MWLSLFHNLSTPPGPSRRLQWIGVGRAGCNAIRSITATVEPRYTTVWIERCFPETTILPSPSHLSFEFFPEAKSLPFLQASSTESFWEARFNEKKAALKEMLSKILAPRATQVWVASLGETFAATLLPKILSLYGELMPQKYFSSITMAALPLRLEPFWVQRSAQKALHEMASQGQTSLLPLSIDRWNAQPPLPRLLSQLGKQGLDPLVSVATWLIALDGWNVKGIPLDSRKSTRHLFLEGTRYGDPLKETSFHSLFPLTGEEIFQIKNYGEHTRGALFYAGGEEASRESLAEKLGERLQTSLPFSQFSLQPLALKLPKNSFRYALYVTHLPLESFTLSKEQEGFFQQTREQPINPPLFERAEKVG